jgi:uncharacterized protein YecT (DUF1311 family)
MLRPGPQTLEGKEMHVMKGRMSWLLISALICTSFAVVARAQHMNAPDSPCKEAVATSDMVKCLNQALQTADATLNSTYARVKNGLDATELQQLLQAQRFWIQFRDATCNAEHDLYGRGTGGPPARLACLEAQTRFREADLLTTYGWRLQKRGL